MSSDKWMDKMWAWSASRVSLYKFICRLSRSAHTMALQNPLCVCVRIILLCSALKSEWQQLFSGKRTLLRALREADLHHKGTNFIAHCVLCGFSYSKQSDFIWELWKTHVFMRRATRRQCEKCDNFVKFFFLFHFFNDVFFAYLSLLLPGFAQLTAAQSVKTADGQRGKKWKKSWQNDDNIKGLSLTTSRKNNIVH